ncbi:MAG: zinc-ribbon domain-containing protein, partial [Ruminococcus sp.]|nr:zinc-ribbon domain-containing protein [Ruminococcus sp.]
MICKNCNKENPDNSKFCSKCGASLLVTVPNSGFQNPNIIKPNNNQNNQQNQYSSYQKPINNNPAPSLYKPPVINNTPKPVNNQASQINQQQLNNQSNPVNQQSANNSMYKPPVIDDSQKTVCKPADEVKNQTSTEKQSTVLLSPLDDNKNLFNANIDSNNQMDFMQSNPVPQNLNNNFDNKSENKNNSDTQSNINPLGNTDNLASATSEISENPINPAISEISSDISSDGDKNKKKKNKNIILIICAIVLAALILIGVIVYIFVLSPKAKISSAIERHDYEQVSALYDEYSDSDYFAEPENIDGIQAMADNLLLDCQNDAMDELFPEHKEIIEKIGATVPGLSDTVKEMDEIMKSRADMASIQEDYDNAAYESAIEKAETLKTNSEYTEKCNEIIKDSLDQLITQQETEAVYGDEDGVISLLEKRISIAEELKEDTSELEAKMTSVKELYNSQQETALIEILNEKRSAGSYPDFIEHPELKSRARDYIEKLTSGEASQISDVTNGDSDYIEGYSGFHYAWLRGYETAADLLDDYDAQADS